MQKLDLRL